MKAEILKIAGVKSEKEFYKKYPTEEAFMKAHGKEFKRYQKPMKQGGQLDKLNQLTNFTNDVDDLIPMAEMGDMIGSYTGGDVVPNAQPIVLNDLYAQNISQLTGLSEEKAKEQADLFQQPQAPRVDWKATMNALGQAIGGGDKEEARKGKKVPKYQVAPAPIPMSPNIPNLSQFASTVTAAPNIGSVAPTGGVDRVGGLMGKMGGIQNITNIAGDILGGIQGLKQEKQQLINATATKNISDVVRRAAGTRPEQMQRQYLRPEDALVQPNQLFPSYGVGTNYLSRNGSVVRAEDGMQIGGNLTEIQNTYAPGTLYDDLGYQPLDNPNQVKQYYHGGVHRAQFGDFLSQNAGAIQAGGNLVTNVAGANNAGSQLGRGIGTAIGTAIPIPGLGAALGAVGGLAGGLLDQKAKKIKKAQEATQRNVQATSLQQGFQALGAQNAGFVRNGGNIPGMEEGGWVSHDWQPQVITTFGEHKLSDLLKPDPMMDTLRTGGHITQNNMFPTDKYALGGELKTTWGGYAEPISYNPYMPGTGETVMFRGKSHEESDGNGHTGIGVKYGQGEHDSYTDYAEYGTENADADVEVERGEPAQEMIDSKTGEKNLVVSGNLKIPNMFLNLLGDPKAKGKKFKHYVNDLSKIEDRQNKIIEKATDKLSQLDPHTPFDLLKMNGLQANIDGANMVLKDTADKKTIASHLQNSINETAEERGVDADALAKGKIKIDKEAMKQQARFGKEILRYQNSGPNVPLTDDEKHYNEIMDLYQKAKDENAKRPGKKNQYALELQKKYHEYFPDIAMNVILNAGDVTAKARSKGIKSVDDLKKLPKEKVLDTNVDEYFGPRTEQYIAALKKPARSKPVPASFKFPTVTDTTKEEESYPVTPLKKSRAVDFINAILPYIDQPTYSPDPNINPEMMAMAMNVLEPVKAQLYHPDLGTPMDISLQDQMNANQADFNALQSQIGYSPAALSALAAQKYAANSSVLGQQFRLNQAEKQRVYEGNRALLNEAQLKNLDILDKQFVRQETAKSNTKETALAAMKSIADKFDKKRLQDQTLDVYRNMFPNYRFNKNLTAIPRNLTTFRIDDNTGGIPSTATPPYVSNKTAATTNNTAAQSSQGSVPNNISFIPNPGGFPIPIVTTSDGVPNLTNLAMDMFKLQKNGGKTKKDKRNSNLVKAFRNL